jgi:hypothetical protein
MLLMTPGLLLTGLLLGSTAAPPLLAALRAVERAEYDLVSAQAALDAARTALTAARAREAEAEAAAAAAALGHLEQQQQQQHSPPQCPQALTAVDSFIINGTAWVACEDLAVHGGALALLSSTGVQEWFSKSFEPYIQGADEDYYLGLGKETVLAAKIDLLGQTILTECEMRNPASALCEPTWARVEEAVPVMRKSGESGVRTFVGSRGSSVDATFSDKAEDKSSNGFPPVQSFVMNLTAMAAGEPPIADFTKYINWSYVADGLVGGVEPNVIFYFPLQDNYSTSWSTGERYCHPNT